MTHDLPFLIFDGNARLRKTHGAEWIFPEFPDLDAIGERFLHSLRSGDRKRFLEYCTEPLFPDSRSVSCEIFSPSALPSFRYAFCEKNVTGGQFFTTVFLAEDMGQFHRLMSPASIAYSRTTERILREILLLAGEPDPEPSALMPDTILALRVFPTALRVLMEPERGKGLCDVYRITEAVVRNLRESPLFLHTTFRFPSSSAEADPSLRILEFSAELYVHILTSLLTVLMTISADHILTLDVRPFTVLSENAPLAADITLTTIVRHPEDYRNDSGSLRSLAVPGSASETLLTVAAVLAYTAGFETSVRVDYRTQKLSICLTVNPDSDRPATGFKYRDPYGCVPAVTAEILGFCTSLQP